MVPAVTGFVNNNVFSISGSTAAIRWPGFPTHLLYHVSWEIRLLGANYLGRLNKGSFQKLLSEFCPLRGYPPPPPLPTPLTENHFAKKTLAERGGIPPHSPLTESPLSFSGNLFS